VLAGLTWVEWGWYSLGDEGFLDGKCSDLGYWPNDLWWDILHISLLMRTDSGPTVWTNRLVKDVQVAINNWNTEYDALPLVGGEVLTEDIEIEMKGELLTALLGEPVAGNERGITFFADPPSKGTRGLVEQDGVVRLLDQWGTPVRVLFDGDHDNKVANPDVKNADEAIRSGAPPQLRTLVAVFSAGKDGVFFTKDDVVSWR